MCMTVITLGVIGLCYTFDQTEQLRLASVTTEELEKIEQECAVIWKEGKQYEDCVEGKS